MTSSRPGDPPGAAHLWEICQLLDLCLDAFVHPYSGLRAIRLNVIEDCLAVGLREDRPLQPHRLARLADPRHRRCHAAQTGHHHHGPDHGPGRRNRGFLLAAHEYIGKHYTAEMDTDEKHFLKLHALRDVEIVDAAARLCAMNLFLHGIGGDTSPRSPQTSQKTEPLRHQNRARKQAASF